MLKITILAAFLVTFMYSCKKDEANNPCEISNVSFETDVFPIFQNGGCTSNYCHGQAPGQDGVILGTYQDITTSVTEERLLGAISHKAGYSPMPKTGGKLSDCQIETIRVWYSEGAKNN